MTLEGKSALVTGGARRVGRQIALALARRGMNVAVHYNRSRADAAALARELARAHGVRAVALRAELSNARACAALAGEAARRLGGLHAVVNNASLWEPNRFGKTSESDWDRHMDVNARAPFFLAQAAAPHLKRAGGCIVNIADWAAHRPYADYIPYCVSKAALLCLNTALAKALAPQVRVNAVMPGPVLLPDGESAAGESGAALKRATLLKRLGSPADVAKAVVFLLESDFITGASVAVDGGRLIA